jgi:hypothetical protein
MGHNAGFRPPAPGGAIRAALVALAVGAWLLPLPARFVERAYSTGVYPWIQDAVTALSNLVAVAALDLLLIAVAGWWLWRAARDTAASPRAWLRVGARTITAVAVVYVAFVALWGLNYRRLPLPQKLPFDAANVSDGAAQELARRAVDELNTPRSAIDPALAQAFERAQALVGVPHSARPGRPKKSVLDPYFRMAAVEGMTNPFFLETLVSSTLLPVERPFVVAHEWSHLAGFADEGEANFVGWLTCISGDAWARYSGWLFLYREVSAGFSRDVRAQVGEHLLSGPRADLTAIAERHRQEVNRVISSAGWRVYDQYLKANRVEAGAASYATVVRLVLGLDIAAAWRQVTTRDPPS